MSGDQIWHLAHFNIARLIAPMGEPRVQPFFDQLAPVNALAEAAPGFVWRYRDDPADMIWPDPLLIINLSVWTDADALAAFAYRGQHGAAMAQRRDWFEPAAGANVVLWWIPAGTRPTVAEAFARLWVLDRFGPGEKAFTFRSRFAASAQADAA